MPPSVAIITRAKNEMPHARRAMEALQRQTRPVQAFLAVDSGSTDGTDGELLKAGADLARIAPADYVPGKVLNAAIGRADHDLIVLLNADAVPRSDDWLEKLIAPIAAGRADATFSKQVARADARFIVADDYARAYDPANLQPDFFSAVACTFRRSLWEARPFRETGYAEDAAWAKACVADGARIEYVNDSVVEHSHNYPLKELFQKRHRQSLTVDGTPHAARQTVACLREIARDLFRAAVRIKLHTIPYNIAYRVTIHRAIYRGLKER